LLVLATIAIGLLSRQWRGIPLWMGDALYAIMMYFIIRFILVNRRHAIAAGISFDLCFLIEFSQLCQQPWIIALRHTLPGKLILGQGFLWSDLAAYLAGTLLGVTFDRILIKRYN